MAANELQRLLVKEVSGVDDPANESPGWMVQKAKGETPEPTAEEAAEAVSTLAKIKEFILGKSAGETDDEGNEVEMTKEELQKELDDRFGALAEALTEKVADLMKTADPEKPAVEESEAPAAPEVPAVPAPEAAADETPALTADDVAKAIAEGIETAQKPVLEILEKTLERLERTEDMLSIRKSLDGQEGSGDGAPKAPTLGDAVAAALRGKTVELT